MSMSSSISMEGFREQLAKGSKNCTAKTSNITPSTEVQLSIAMLAVGIKRSLGADLAQPIVRSLHAAGDALADGLESGALERAKQAFLSVAEELACLDTPQGDAMASSMMRIAAEI